MTAPALNDDFLDMIDTLTSAGVDFVVVGAHALASHGLPRATGDIDLLVRPSAENASRVVRALTAFGAPLQALTEITGVMFDEAWSTRMAVSVSGRQFSVLGREALLRNKRATGRDEDLVDATALERGDR